MKRIVLSAVALVVCFAVSAQAAPKDDVTAAAKKLSDAASYSWKTTSEMGGNAFVVEGKAEKGGYTKVSSTFGDNTSEFVLKGEKSAIKTDAGWKTVEEALQAGADQPNPNRFLARMVQGFKAPAAQAEGIAADVKELKVADDAISGDLTEEGAKKLLTFGGRGNNAPTIANAKGSAKFWVKDGMLTKFQYHVTGTVTFNNNDRDVDRTTTIEIKEVGTTKVEVAEEAKKKLP